MVDIHNLCMILTILGYTNCIDSVDSIESEDSTDSIDSIDIIDSIDSILVPHKRPPTFTPHTKGARDSIDGGGAEEGVDHLREGLGDKRVMRG